MDQQQTVGRYSIVERIGRGAMGEVFKAFDPILNRHVAIKMLTSQLGFDAEMRKRFEREAQSAARLTHPNIVTVYELGEEQGAIFIAMELLEGRDLKDLIGLPELRDLGERLRIMDQVLAGVSFAHERGIVHRDLKPANIRVLPSGQVKVVDFGLARMATGAEMTQAGTVLGTPNYMSPEQVRGEKADAASDVFALGAVLYEVLAARKAFHTESLHTTLAKVLTDDPEPLHVVAPEIPLPVVEVVVRAVHKTRASRYAHAGEMRAALQAAAPTVTSPSRSRRSGSGDSSYAGIRPLAAGRPGAGSVVAKARQAEPDARGETIVDAHPTYVPERTSASARPSETMLVTGAGARSGAVYAGLGVLIAAGAIAGGFYFLRQSRATPPSTTQPTAEGATQLEGVLSEQYVESLLQLARLDLENKNYAGAAQRAQEALQEDATSAAARDVLNRANAAIQQRDAAAREAQQALAGKDMTAASQALSRLLELDPLHPAVPPLSSALNATFQERAQAARASALAMRQSAAGQAAGVAGLGEADALVQQADGLLERGEYAAATGRFTEARDAFGRAQRSAKAQQAERQRQEAERQKQEAERQRQAEAQRQAQLRAAQRTAEPTRAAEGRTPTLAPPVSNTAAPPTLAVVPPAVTPNPEEPALRQALVEYERALEGKDMVSYRAIKPNVGADEQKKLEATFKFVKAWDVGLRIEAIEVNGAQAVVRAARQDTVNGTRTPASRQVFRLAQAGGAWKIESIGQ